MLLLAFALTLGAANSGCTLAAFGKYALGADDIPAQYTLAQVPTLIIVKALPDPTGLNSESEPLAAAIENQITAHQLCPVIPSVAVRDMRVTRFGETTSRTPLDTAHTLGAAQLILVRITENSISGEATPDMLKGRIGADVSVYDVASGQLLWPHDGAGGAPMHYETPLLRKANDVQSQSIQRNLEYGLADQIGKLFYKYKPE